jgi:hypothetical protein
MSTESGFGVFWATSQARRNPPALREWLSVFYVAPVVGDDGRQTGIGIAGQTRDVHSPAGCGSDGYDWQRLLSCTPTS